MNLLALSLVEGLGYFATAAVLSSFLMTSMVLLRLVNTMGCLLFIVYGILLVPHSNPIIITNAAIVCINSYHLTKKGKQE